MPKPADKPLFEVRSSPIHGRGVFAVRDIRAGTRLIEYTGERITDEQAAERYSEGDDTPEAYHTFLFSLEDGMVIDAAVDGNEARFINHCCEPNCKAFEVNGRIYLDAISTIGAGTELVYDYHLTRPSGRYRASWRQRFACHCGAPNCRGTMLEAGILREPKKKKK
jgi:hypothetical protein